MSGVELTALPASGDVLVSNTDPAQRGSFHQVLEEALAPYRRTGAC